MQCLRLGSKDFERKKERKKLFGKRGALTRKRLMAARRKLGVKVLKEEEEDEEEELKQRVYSVAIRSKESATIP